MVVFDWYHYAIPVFQVYSARDYIILDCHVQRIFTLTGTLYYVHGFIGPEKL